MKKVNIMNSCGDRQYWFGGKGWCILFGLLISTIGRAETTVSPDEMAKRDHWVQEHLLKAGVLPPFSFVYGGQPSSKFLSASTRIENDLVLDSNRIQHNISWSDGMLQVTCQAVEYKDYPVVEWIVYLKNVGSAHTGILERIQGLDTEVVRDKGPEFVLNGNKGDQTTKDSYEPYQITLTPSTVNEFGPLHIPDAPNEVTGIVDSPSGKSCDGPRGWPYYNLQVPGGGVILAIGWPGQWSSSFTRDSSSGLVIRAGQQLTHLFLKPGEEIRTPLIALLFWQGADLVRSQNLWRRWFIADNEPHVDGQPQQPMAQASVSCVKEDMTKLEQMLAAGIKIDNCWRDAEGVGGTWWPSENGPYHVVRPGEVTTSALKAASPWWNTGTWEIDRSKFPDGFKPFSDWAHAKGMTLMLWFEPERVGNPNSWLGKNHPDWLLPTNNLTYGIHPSYDPILDEGNPAALKWLIDDVDGIIKSQGIDIYREDMNGAGPCPAWRKNDSQDRQGITENFYVQGHLAFWDELKRRNPHLRIDSCASGGRRNDLETMRRGVSIGNRSDFMFNMPDVVEGNQCQTYGLSSWIPFQGSYCYFHDNYSYRSFYIPDFGEDGDIEVQKKAYGEWRRVAPFMLGDYYPLTRYSLKRDQWIAWQFDRPDLGGGEIQAFRRADSPYEAASFKLKGLEAAARYERLKTSMVERKPTPVRS